MFPSWLHVLSLASLALGLVCVLIILVDVIGHPQHMGVMNVVWPVTALFGSVVVLWGYFRYGRLATHAAASQAKRQGKPMPGKTQTPYPVIVGKGALHCGAGCMIGDIIAEWLAFLIPAVAIWFGYQSIFSDKIYAVWVLDFIFAFGLGIIFQYFAIAPMRGLGPWKGIQAALKADTLSLIAWQVGMYGAMFIAQWIYEAQFGQRSEANVPEFWFAMQIAMVAGFITSYPVNWWLIISGIKEKM